MESQASLNLNKSYRIKQINDSFTLKTKYIETSKK